MEKQFHTYRSSIYSFEATECLLGILKPGRYSGFDFYTLSSQSGANIVVNLSHSTNAIKKSSKSTTPTLGANTGVILTPQGQIIHNDDLSLTLSIAKNEVASIRYDLVYCEHVFVLSKGSNPATYNIQQGTPGAGVPTLLYPEKRVLIGIVTLPASATTFAQLTFTPSLTPELGSLEHQQVVDMLFGNYSSNHYISNGATVIDNLSSLDLALYNQAQTISAWANTKLDDWAMPDDNTDLNATVARHGLLPKLSGNALQFLNGSGQWASPKGWQFLLRTTVADFSLSAGTFQFLTTNSGYLDISSLVISDANSVLVNVMFSISLGTGTASSSKGSIFFSTEDQKDGFACIMPQSTDENPSYSMYWQFAIPLQGTTTKRIYFRAMTIRGVFEEWFDTIRGLNDCHVVVRAYQ